MLSMYTKVVKFYSYRTAMVRDHFFSLDYARGDKLDHLQQWLVESFPRARMDNHTCFAIESEERAILYIQFSDWKMYVGANIIEGPW